MPQSTRSGVRVVARMAVAPFNAASPHQQQQQSGNIIFSPQADTSRIYQDLGEADNDLIGTFGHGEDRPQKRRKIDVRPPALGQQRTLDSFFQPGQPKPPSKVTISQPHGHLIHTINGVRSELDIREDAISHATDVLDTPSRVLPSEPVAKVQQGKKGEKRTLRSQDEGPRLKSELATYFPNYEDIIFDTPKEQDLYTVDTAIYIAEDAGKSQKMETTSPSKSAKSAKSTPASQRFTSNGVQSPTSPSKAMHQFNGAAVLDFSVFARNLPDQPDDPLREEFFIKSHRRAERKEKQLRNIEREKAMHEKVQLDRLLDGLLGHDWLRVLGITGITDGEAKKYEPKRDYFIAEVQSLVDKFKEWRDEEKRQKLEKEAAIAAERQAEEGQDEGEDAQSDDSSLEPPSSDLNASAARQLQLETVSAMKASSAHKRRARERSPLMHKEPAPPPPPPPLLPYRPPSPIVSFYEKKHMREAALKKTRHGRNVTAFGQPLPEMEEQDFELPAEYLTEDVIKASARERRRRKREGAANTTSSANA